MKKSIIIILGPILFFTLVASFLLSKQINIAENINLSLIANSNSEWSTPVNISNSSATSYFPKVAANDYGMAYAIWVEENQGKAIYFNTNESGNWNSKGENVTQNQVRVREGPWPAINVDGEGNVCIVYTAVTDGNYEVVFNRRVKGTWEGHENVSKTYTGGSVSGSILIDKNENHYYVIWQDDIDRPSEESAFWLGYVRYKAANSGSWVGAGAIPDPGNRAYSHQAVMNDKGKAFVVWVNRKIGNISRVFFSENPTPQINSAWSNALNLSDLTGLQWAEPKIACDNNNNVYLVWQDGREGNSEIYFRKRINKKWSKIENLSQTLTTSELPTIAVDPNNGKIYVAWQENASNWEIYYREYIPGQGWSHIQNMSNTSTTSAQPHLFVDGLGGVHLVFTDFKSGSWNVYYRHKEGLIKLNPPVNLQLQTMLDTSTTPPSKLNLLSWEDNPNNQPGMAQYFRIYRKEEGADNSSYQLIDEVSGDIFVYEDNNLPTSVKYVYRLTVVSSSGLESEETSDSVHEQIIFPPLNFSLETFINRVLFYKEKINLLEWSKNPLNDALKLQSYEILSKEAEAPDSSFQVIGSVNAGTYTFQIRGLPIEQKFAYKLRVIDVNGNVAESTETVSEK